MEVERMAEEKQKKPHHNVAEWYAAQTPEARAELNRKAGEASGKARRKYSTFRALLKQALLLDVDDPQLRLAMEGVGLEPTRQNAIILAAIAKAGTGDIEAARFVRDTIGEKPTEQYNIATSDKPIKALDLSGMSDDELEALADSVDE
jgi:hypothetical protein